MSPRSRRLTEEIDTARRFYENGLSIYDLAEVYDVSAETVRRHLRAAGVEMRSGTTVTAWGESKSVADWSRDPRCATTRKSLRWRIGAGWDPEEAISTGPVESDGSPRKPRP